MEERPVQFVSAVNDKSDFWKLVVKVKDKWTVVKDGREHLEIVIVDAKGNDIQVIIPTEYKSTYDKIIEENSTYKLCNFHVLPNDFVFKASEHKFKLKWTGGTTAEYLKEVEIPNHRINFKPFAEIVAGKWKPDILYHVIGVVQDMGYCQLIEGTGKKLQVNFTMKDLSDISINCTLWEDYASKFLKFNNERKEFGPVVVMLTYAKLKEEGRFPLSVSNTYGYTKLFINDDVAEMMEFKECLPKEGPLCSQSQLVCTQSSTGSQFNSEDDLLSKNLVLPLSQIVQLDQITYVVTVATVDKVNSTKHGWYYLACHKCPKQAKGDKPPYTCDSGHNTETEIVRYKLELDVSYEDTKTTFVLWDAEVTQLLKISAADLRINMINAGITNRFEYPMLMDKLAEKTWVAKVKWQPKWKSCSVVCIKTGQPFVNQVCEKFPHFQAAAPIHVHEAPDNIVDSQNITDSVHDLSGTSEYDPELLTQQTPISSFKIPANTKDLDGLSQMTPFSNKSLSDVADFELLDTTPPTKGNPRCVPTASTSPADIPPTKHSSSKRVKLIKQEK